MDKQGPPSIRYKHDKPLPSEGIACMSYVWDSARVHPPGVVRTLGMRLSLDAPSWTHAASEVTWGSVAYLQMPATSDNEVEAAHEELCAVLQGQAWPAGFDEAVRRWGVSAVARDLP